MIGSESDKILSKDEKNYSFESNWKTKIID